MSIGYIKLHRSILDWQYWDDKNTTRLLIYLLVKVNYETKSWKGYLINPGSLITSYEKIAIATGLSVGQVRRSLDVLENDKQISRKTTNKNQYISLVKWEELQLETKKTTSKRQTKQLPNNSETATTKEDILLHNISEENKKTKHSLIEWLLKYSPNVQKMVEPITNEQAEKIQFKFNAVHTSEVFQSMHNFKDLLKKNNSAYLTFCNWMRRRQSADFKYGLKAEDNKPKFKAPWD